MHLLPKAKTSLDKLEFSNKPKLIIKEGLIRQINKLHKLVGSFEWSGELITSEEGVITDLGKWTVTAHDIFLNDIGTSGGTSYKVDEGSFKGPDIVDLYDRFPGLLTGQLKNHHIHTHHNMGSFFSGTDWENLEERSMESNYFMMLIVDFKGDFIAKVAFKAKVGQVVNEVSFANDADNVLGKISYDRVKEEDRLVVMDMEVEKEELTAVDSNLSSERIGMSMSIITETMPPGRYEWFKDKFATFMSDISEEMSSEPDEWFMERYNKVRTVAEEDKKKPVTTHYNYTNKHVDRQRNLFGQDSYDSEYVPPADFSEGAFMVPGEKPIMQMTEKEWNAANRLDPITLMDAFRLVNTVLNNAIDTRDYSNPMDDMRRRYNYMANKDLETEAEEFLVKLDCNMEEVYPMADDDWKDETLKFINERIFEKDNSVRLANAMSRMIRIELKKRERGTNKSKNLFSNLWR